MRKSSSIFAKYRFFAPIIEFFNDNVERVFIARRYVAARGVDGVRDSLLIHCFIRIYPVPLCSRSLSFEALSSLLRYCGITGRSSARDALKAWETICGKTLFNSRLFLADQTDVAFPRRRDVWRIRRRNARCTHRALSNWYHRWSSRGSLESTIRMLIVEYSRVRNCIDAFIEYLF